jgi:hypothetical protein
LATLGLAVFGKAGFFFALDPDAGPPGAGVAARVVVWVVTVCASAVAGRPNTAVATTRTPTGSQILERIGVRRTFHLCIKVLPSLVARGSRAGTDEQTSTSAEDRLLRGT